MTISTTDITTGEKAGRGFFDELMRTSLDHIKEEFIAGRITDKNYATVYLGTLQSNLQTASSFVLQYELNNIQIKIQEQNLINTQKQSELLDTQIEQNNVQTSLLNHELNTMRPLQEDQLQQQIALASSQTTGQNNQNALLVAQVNGQEQQNLILVKQEDLLDKQILTETANTDATGITSGLIYEQLQKTQAETSVVEQRRVTEQAQTLGQTTEPLNANYVGGLLGAEIMLKQEQRDSFLRDAEQKAVKFYSDLLSIVYSTNPEAEEIELWGFSPANSFNAVSQLLEGINVNPVAP